MNREPPQMETLMTTFLLFLAAIVALVTYLIVPRMPVATLISVAAVSLAIGVWWHWTQFAVDYRTSTWQEQLRYYASYALVLIVILLSYAFYVFAWSGSSLQDYAASAAGAVRNVGRRTLSRVSSNVSRATSATSSALFSEASPEETVATAGLESETSPSETAAANFF
jgi:hypothetical protein